MLRSRMDSYRPSTYGDRIAEIYDDWHPTAEDAEQAAAVLAKLREKPGGADIPVDVGDFSDVDVDGSFPLIFVVFNTFFVLLSQEDQVRCFRNVAAHLAPGGAFLMEAFVPDPTMYASGQRVAAT